MKLLEFSKRFPDETSCEEYLREKREKTGIVCSKCGNTHHYCDKTSKRWCCVECGHKTTLISGTVMHDSKLPLLYWFTAIHLLTVTKKTFSTLEIQRQLGHKRYHPIWEMMHKLCSVMDDKYQLRDTVELDEAYFIYDDVRGNDERKDHLKSGPSPERNVKVMAESEECKPKKKEQKSRKANHIKMKVMEDLHMSIVNSINALSSSANIIVDAYKSHSQLDNIVGHTNIRVVKLENAPKMLSWVHMAIANARNLFRDIYHGIRNEFLQEYLNEFCYNFNRRFFGNKLRDRLVIGAVSHKSPFARRLYETNISFNCR